MTNRIYAIMTALLILAMAGSAMCAPTGLPDQAATQAEQKAIDVIQKAIDAKGYNWTAGATSVSGLSDEEKKKLCGAKPDKELKGKEPKKDKSKKPAPPGTYPDSFDWHNNGGDWMTSVKDQGGCGSCWAFSALGVVEAAINIYANDPTFDADLSEQHLVSDCYPSGDCDGGWPTTALAYVRDTGVPSENCFPYTATECACTPCDGWSNNVWTIENRLYIQPSVSNFKSALQEYGPLSAIMVVPDDWFYYTGGVYEPTCSNPSYPTGKLHAIVVVGWNDTEGCWIIKNSWGDGWGEEGYGRVLYGDIEQHQGAYVVTGIPTYLPKSIASASPESGTAPLNVAFTGTGIDIDGTITSYEWTFGDGASSTSQNPTHTYDDLGMYTATLTVTDNEGHSGSDSIVITNGVIATPVAALASSSQDDFYQPENAIDGDHDTCWLSSMNDQSPWIQFDFGSSVIIHSLVVSMYTHVGYSEFDIVVSNDGYTWYTVDENVCVPEDETGVEIVLNTPYVRYVSFELEKSSIVEGCYEMSSILLSDYCKGDFCGISGGSSPPDGYIGQSDFVKFGTAYGTTLGDPTYDVIGDFDDDCDIDFDDFVEFAGVFETSCG